MASTIRIVGLTTLVLGALAAGGLAGFAYSGSYNVGADDPHGALVYSALEVIRDRSIKAHAAGLQAPPDITDKTRIVQGAGNYAAMCAGCHLPPGVNSSELSAGLYPSPPHLTQSDTGLAEAFWVIKHGIKASGMPAWGRSMDDDSMWNLAAFLQVLPTLDDAAYDQLVASSGGHSHGGNEAGGGHTDDRGEHGEHGEDGEHGSVGHSHSHGDESPMDKAMGSAEAAHAHSPPKSQMATAGATSPTAEKLAPAHDNSDGHHDRQPHEPQAN